VQQILSLGPAYRLVSILSTEAQLTKLTPDLIAADAAYAAADATAATADPNAVAAAPCMVFAGGRADVSSATGFKHSALSVLAIIRRPTTAVSVPVTSWAPSLTASAGTLTPTVLVLDGVIKPENVGALFRTALAFGVCGVILSPGCADPLYRKAIRASMGGCFKLPYIHAPRWPLELGELQSCGWRLLALHLQGSVAHDEAIGGAPAAGASDAPRSPIAVMVGAEYEGVSEAAAERADVRVRIPMSDAMAGCLDSLNVNVAAAIVLERVFSGNRARAESSADA
jgi:tRNA G18 (ribose-2'-O)-methylase SpoU